MYAKGMSQRDIADTIEDIYGFEICHETISSITDQVIETAKKWQSWPLKKFYTFLFVDCQYVNVRKDMETKSCAIYVVLGYDVNGVKDILGIRIGEDKGRHYWMQIFEKSKAGVWRTFSLLAWKACLDRKKGHCIVHLIRKSVKYIPSKDYKALFT